MWGGLPKKDISKFQVLINKSARIITGRPRKTRTRILMQECNWLYFEEMVEFQSLLALWKMTRLGVPYHLSKAVTMNDNNYVSTAPGRIAIVRNSFIHRSVRDWNNMSLELRESQNFIHFKRALKKDIIGKRPVIAPQQGQRWNWD